MDKLKKERTIWRTKLTRLCNKYDGQDIVDIDELSLAINDVKNIRDKLQSINDAIHISDDFDVDDLEQLLEEEQPYDDRAGLFITKSERILKSRIAGNSSGASHPASAFPMAPVTSDATRNQKISLPQVSLPTFSNKTDENFNSFIKAFKAIIDKHNLSSSEKHAFLKGQLSGGPLALIKSIDINATDQYQAAVDLLEEAFGNVDSAKQDVLRRLAGLKQTHGVDPYVFVGELKSITTNFDSLQIKVEDVLQYFIWNSFDELFKQHLTAITNKNFPSLDEMNKGLFEACSRYARTVANEKASLGTQKQNKPLGSATNTAMATNVKTKHSKNPLCVLCRADKKSSDHWMVSCSVYKTAKQKCDKLKTIGGCLRCSFANHKSYECNFKFSSNCQHCQKPHMSYLCLSGNDSSPRRGKPSKGDFTNNNNSSKSSTNVSSVGVDFSVEMATSTIDNPVILPTFTARVHGAHGEISKVRVFKDGGSQKSFITRSLADKHNFEVLHDNVKLTINGFNESKTVPTQVVAVPITIGNTTSIFEAFVTDHIRTKFLVPDIHIITNHFQSKGYTLADDWLINDYSGIVSNMGIILGTNDDALIPMTTKVFGDISNQSSYLETKIGVVLSGDIPRIIKNLPYLPVDHLSVACHANVSNTVPFTESDSCFKEKDKVSVTQTKEFQGVLDYSIIKDNFDDLEFTLTKTLGLVTDTDEHKDESEVNVRLVNYILDSSSRADDGRLIFPIAWNEKNCHLLSRNYNLCKQILNSTYKKLSQNKTKLSMYDAVFREQLEMGIIEKIHNIEDYINLHPECSFLAHMGVFRMTHDSTKCRVVFLANLCEKRDGNGLSHNRTILPGPCLNQKMSTALTLLRFDKYLLTFDLQKAFLMIGLREVDINRLLFLWYNNIEKDDFSIVGYRSLRLPFGLPCSPTILMLALYKMLILDQTNDQYSNELKKAVYNTMYVDNGAYTTNDANDLGNAYTALPKIFGDYKFKLQQFYTNEIELQTVVDRDFEIESSEKIKLFGLMWDRINDVIHPTKIQLNESASTKSEVLSSLNGVFDVFNVYAPFLLRPKLFMQKLQTMSDLKWNDPLPAEMKREWSNIARQANMTPEIGVNRSMGKRDSRYSMICFTDSSGEAYGTVLYLKDLETNQVSFLLAKSKVLNDDMRRKTIPTLELKGIEFGVETLIDAYQSIAGETVVIPVNIESLYLYTDSTACLGWLNSHSIKYDKIQRLSVFVRNRLDCIDNLCKIKSVKFRHVSGEINPADSVSRPTSYRVLQKDLFYYGPNFLKSDLENDKMDSTIIIPNPFLRNGENLTQSLVTTALNINTSQTPGERAIPIEKFSDFERMVQVTRNVLIFVNKLKKRVQIKKNIEMPTTSKKFRTEAINSLLQQEQMQYFREIFEYFEKSPKNRKDIPDLILRCNLFLDENGILRVKSKIPSGFNTPALLPKESHLTTCLIRHIHEKLSHSGMFPVLKELHKNFYICNYFTVVKKVLRKCVACKRQNEPPIKITQNEYREFRFNPGKRPYSYVGVDYAGPFTVVLNGEKKKVYLLLITCLYTRAINIKICRSASVEDFLRALQMHIYQHGMFEYFLSDMGSQIIAGVNQISTFLDDPCTKEYFEANGVQPVRFSHFAKGNSSLGSIFETCIKQTKRLIQKSVRTLVIDYFSFELLICKTIDLLNKRPVAFKESLKNLPDDEVPSCITPEMLIRGYETCTLNIIPQIQSTDFSDPDFQPSSATMSRDYQNICKVKSNLVEIYHSEFITNLITQAIDKRDRYKPVNHKRLSPGDIVLLVEPHQKRCAYPMARVQRVVENDLGEVTAAYVYKGATKELVFRHVNSLILLISVEGLEDTSSNISTKTDPCQNVTIRRKQPRRIAGEKCKDALKRLADV